jgi:hypothetical protein
MTKRAPLAGSVQMSPPWLRTVRAGEGQPKPEAILLACRDEWLERSVANLMRNAGPRIFHFEQYTTYWPPGLPCGAPPLHARTYQRQLHSLRRFEQDLNEVQICVELPEE